mmetsp:Transcript_15202/g.16747  ORF Transcript_15202/g.16747 Transcript_15202/m.16747 type:complete len:179 (-) Transcript_15202:193-729(-)
MTKSFKIFWDLQCPYSKKMWEQYRGYNKKHTTHHHTYTPSAVVLENVLGVVGKQQQQHRLVNSSSSSSSSSTGSTLLGPIPVDEKYIPKTIIRREYNGHARQELFTVYITSYVHHPQAFAAHCGTSLIDTMKGRDVMFKYFENSNPDQLSSILGSTRPSSTCSVIAKQQNLQEQLVAA